MKKVNVTFFAAFRDQAGRDSAQIETSAETVSVLFTELKSRWDRLESYASMKFAVNDDMVAADHALEDGDQVLFFPPVAGG